MAAADAKSLQEVWGTKYPEMQPQARLMGSDTLVSRTYREWRQRIATVVPCNKIRSQITQVEPKKETKTQLDHRVYLGTLVDNDTQIRTVVDYYFALRVLANVWGYVGSYTVEHKGEKVLMMPLGAALDYADNTLAWTMDVGGGGSRQARLVPEPEQ